LPERERVQSNKDDDEGNDQCYQYLSYAH
jgi:hypothetical protein